MNPSILYFSPTGSAFKALFFLGFAVAAFLFASLRYQEDNAPPQIVRTPGGLELPMRAPDRGPLAPFEIVLLIGAGCVALFYVGRHGAIIANVAPAVHRDDDGGARRRLHAREPGTNTPRRLRSGR